VAPLLIVNNVSISSALAAIFYLFACRNRKPTGTHGKPVTSISLWHTPCCYTFNQPANPSRYCSLSTCYFLKMT
jgi:hypothetical protein